MRKRVADAPVPRPGKPRLRIGIRVMASLGLLTFSFMLVFVVNDAATMSGEAARLVPPGSFEARVGAEHPGESVHLTGAVVALVIGASGLIGLIVAPSRRGFAHQTLAAVAAMLIAIGITGNPDNRGGQAGAVDLAFLVMAIPSLVAALLAIRGRRPDAQVDPPHLFLFATAAPGVWYGIEQALIQRNTWPPLADPHHQAHWYAMAVAAFAVVLAVAAAAFRGEGWQVGGILAGLGALVIAVASVADTSAASALPRWAAVGAAAWGLLVLARTYRAWREMQPTRGLRPADSR